MISLFSDAYCLAPTGNSLKAERRRLLVPFIIFRVSYCAMSGEKVKSYFCWFFKFLPQECKIHSVFTSPVEGFSKSAPFCEKREP